MVQKISELPSAGLMNHLDVDVLVATTAFLCPPLPHQLEDGMNQVLLKSPINRLQLPIEPKFQPKENRREHQLWSGSDEFTVSNVSAAYELPDAASSSIVTCGFARTGQDAEEEIKGRQIIKI